MKEWKLHHYSVISERSNIAYNIGQIPKEAKVIKTFKNTNSGILSSITDLQLLKNKRNKYLLEFLYKYKKYFEKKEISILTGVINLEHYTKIGSFVSDFKKKLKRKNIDVYGYVWVRDFGNEMFKIHAHILIATARINETTFSNLFSKKTHSKYNFQFAKSIGKLTNYLKKKELYGVNKMRAYSKSRKFLTPKKII
ncbi:MAG: hypothetical protein WC223_02535 [Bacteroidales bacterium]|jgi:hypothetical protein